MGKSLDVHFYDSLHRTEDTNQNNSTEVRTENNQAINDIQYETTNLDVVDSVDIDTFTDSATEELSNLFESLKEKIAQGNKQFNSSTLVHEIVENNIFKVFPRVNKVGKTHSK